MLLAWCLSVQQQYLPPGGAADGQPRLLVRAGGQRAGPGRAAPHLPPLPAIHTVQPAVMTGHQGGAGVLAGGGGGEDRACGGEGGEKRPRLPHPVQFAVQAGYQQAGRPR